MLVVFLSVSEAFRATLTTYDIQNLNLKVNEDVYLS
jgi:hypothetical protein